jgi:hypothetical protein
MAFTKDEIHTVMGHGPAGEDVGSVKLGRFAALLINPGCDLLGQFV